MSYGTSPNAIGNSGAASSLTSADAPTSVAPSGTTGMATGANQNWQSRWQGRGGQMNGGPIPASAAGVPPNPTTGNMQAINRMLSGPGAPGTGTAPGEIDHTESASLPAPQGGPSGMAPMGYMNPQGGTAQSAPGAQNEAQYAQNLAAQFGGSSAT